MTDGFSLQAEIKDLERFFLPEDGSPSLAPGMRGQACVNLRHALSMLGYDLIIADAYDAETSKAVRQFQRDRGHRHHDGHCGEGTRRLLVRTLLKKARGFFQRVQDPEHRSIGHVFLSYSRKDINLVQQHEALIAGWGFTPWRDESAIPGGADWSAEISRMIDSAYLFVAFATPNFVKSAMCQVEVERATAPNMPILVVRYGSPPKDHWLSPVLETRQWIAKPPSNIISGGAAEFRRQLRQSLREAQRRYRVAQTR